MKIEKLMNEYYSKFTSNDQYIGQCILNHKNDCIRMSIEEFAHTYHVSSSALSRFAQKLNLPGYSALRAVLRLGEENSADANRNRKRMIQCYGKVIQDIEEKDCTELFEQMERAERIIVFGEGYAQGRVAKEMKRIFLPSRKKIYDVYGVDILQALSSFIQEGDIVFFISLRGEKREVIEFAKELRMRGIYTVSITKMTSNTLSHFCEENLYIQSMDVIIDEERRYSMTTPYFILIELLFVKYKLYQKDKCMHIFPENEKMNER